VNNLGAGLWDVAPLVPIIEEAGGTSTDIIRTSCALTPTHRPGAMRQGVWHGTEGGVVTESDAVHMERLGMSYDQPYVFTYTDTAGTGTLTIRVDRATKATTLQGTILGLAVQADGNLRSGVT
jgi:hypothetical protein